MQSTIVHAATLGSCYNIFTEEYLMGGGGLEPQTLKMRKVPEALDFLCIAVTLCISVSVNFVKVRLKVHGNN